MINIQLPRFNFSIENFTNKIPNILEMYGTAMRRMAMVGSDAKKRKLEVEAREKGILRWTALQKIKVGGVGFLTGLPGGVWVAPMELADLTYLMAMAGRGCYGVGHIFNRAIDYERDIPLILAVWSGAAEVATIATAGQVAMHFARPLIIQHASAAGVQVAGAAVVQFSAFAAAQTGMKFLEKILPKALTKIGSKIASKIVAKSVPVLGGLVACFVNRWICNGLMCAAEKYYSSPILVMEQDLESAPAHS